MKREKELKDFEARKHRALDFASERGVIVAVCPNFPLLVAIRSLIATVGLFAGRFDSTA